jgi:hypothetical protein
MDFVGVLADVVVDAVAVTFVQVTSDGGLVSEAERVKSAH